MGSRVDSAHSNSGAPTAAKAPRADSAHSTNSVRAVERALRADEDEFDLDGFEEIGSGPNAIPALPEPMAAPAYPQVTCTNPFFDQKFWSNVLTNGRWM